MTYRKKVDAQHAHISSLRLIIGLLVILGLYMAYGWQSAPRDLTIHVPPDLRSGSTRHWWDVPTESVYAFGFYIFQQINRWPNDGEVDYEDNITRLGSYLTPSCKAYLQKDFELRRNPSERPPIYAGNVEIASDAPPEEAQDHQHSPALPSQQDSGHDVPTTPQTPLTRSAPTADDPAEVDALLALLTNTEQPAEHAPQMLTPPIPDANACEPNASAVQEAVDPMLTQPVNKTDLGQGFVDWLRAGIASRNIIINDAKALVHTVAGTAMLVTPGVFKRFVQEFPALETQAKAQKLNAWELVQRSFEKLKLHRKTESSHNIWTINVIGPRTTKKLRGYLLIDPLTLFSEVPFDNVSLSLPPSSSGGAE